MFTGQDRSVRLRFKNILAGAVFDRFGRDVMLIPDGEDHFVVTLDVAVSPQFYSWVFGFGTDVEILSPDDIRERAADLAQQIADQYRKK